MSPSDTLYREDWIQIFQAEQECIILMAMQQQNIYYEY